MDIFKGQTIGTFEYCSPECMVEYSEEEDFVFSLWELKMESPPEMEQLVIDKVASAQKVEADVTPYQITDRVTWNKDNLTPNQAVQLLALIDGFSDAFADGSGKLEYSSVVKHHIDLVHKC